MSYLKHLYRYEKTARFKDSDNKEFLGIITGVNQDGKLLVKTSEEVRAFNNREIEFIT